MYNPNEVASGANSAAQGADTEANAVQQANQEGLNNLMGLATGAMGAAGTALSNTNWLGCWIAAELFDGWKDPRTRKVRKWLREEFSKHWYGRMFNRWYSKNGQKVAKRIQSNQPMRWAFQKLFQWFLKQAESKEGVCR
jgi:hypothetical protein